jgi:S-DNA-T family DNA segregation ATPase FtsK/SpoIIIE
MKNNRIRRRRESFLAPSIFLKLKRILILFIAMFLYIIASSYLLTLMSYSPTDTSLNTVSIQPIKNFWGNAGAIIADASFQILGFLAIAPLIIIVRWSTGLVTQKSMPWLWLRFIMIPPALLLLSIALSSWQSEQTLFLPAGAGGALGTVLVNLLMNALGVTIDQTWYYRTLILASFLLGFTLFHWVINVSISSYVSLSIVKARMITRSKTA